MLETKLRIIEKVNYLLYLLPVKKFSYLLLYPDLKHPPKHQTEKSIAFVLKVSQLWQGFHQIDQVHQSNDKVHTENHTKGGKDY